MAIEMSRPSFNARIIFGARESIKVSFERAVPVAKYLRRFIECNKIFCTIETIKERRHCAELNVNHRLVWMEQSHCGKDLIFIQFSFETKNSSESRIGLKLFNMFPTRVESLSYLNGMIVLLVFLYIDSDVWVPIVHLTTLIYPVLRANFLNFVIVPRLRNRIFVDKLFWSIERIEKLNSKLRFLPLVQ